ncbi:TPA: ATP-grasp fold amidoligase family protein [Photobacterium damselae]
MNILKKNYLITYCKIKFYHLLSVVISDNIFRKFVFFLKFKKQLNVKNPKCFNDKINYRVLYDRNDIYTKLADKYQVRDYVAEKIGDSYLIELLAVYEDPNDIDISKLPNKFVIKCNHDAGSVLVVHDKSKIDLQFMRNKYKLALMKNMYHFTREWHYKNIKKKILVEELIDIFVSTNTPEDYKFHCFNGEPRYIEVQFDRFSSKRLINIYDPEWILQPFLMGYENNKNKIEKPNKLSEMLDLARKLSEDFEYCRIDLYCTKEDRIFFGEITFTPCNGMDEFKPLEWGDKFSEDWIIK